jgi:uncharacterized protein (DUF1015 family)
MNFERIGLHVPTVLLPIGADMQKWAVVACDQYHQQREYWEKVKRFVGGSPSTLHMILPEAYLDEETPEDAAKRIASAMKDYLGGGVLAPHRGFVLVDRVTSGGKSRRGLVVALDLEKYDYHKGSKAIIRTTEGTFEDKLAPRVKIRENVPLESPHILVLIDDPKKTVIEPLFMRKLKKLYDFKLMMDGGSIRGYLVDDDEDVESVATALEKLADLKEFKEKYGVDDPDMILYAMGDGNHSFASAQKVWEKTKKNLKGKSHRDHPARYALVELINIHDTGLDVEPIHRVIYGVDEKAFLDGMSEHYKRAGSTLFHRSFRTLIEAKKAAKDTPNTSHAIPYIFSGEFGLLTVENPGHLMAMETLEDYIGEYVKEHKSSRLEFIHGDDIVTSIGSGKGTIGFYLPDIDKHGVFRHVLLHGIYPRKTFSLGHADDKRYYLECRKIVP